MHDQIRALLTAATLEANELVCPIQVATAVAPQLTGLLRIWPGAVSDTAVRLVGSVLAEVDSPWSLIPSVVPSSDDARTAVGKRGEAYSFQFLRGNHDDRSLVLWVAADDETLGYDLESVSGDDRNRIEVKASRDTVVRFILTPNEYRRAHDHGPDYTIHFWGGINLHMDPAHEFAQLLERGYPLVYDNPAQLLADGVLVAEPGEWLVTEAG